MSAERWTKALQSGAETPDGLRRRLAQAKIALDDARYFKQDTYELAGEVEALEAAIAQADTVFAESYGKGFKAASAAPAPRQTVTPNATRDKLVELDRRITDLEYDLQDARRLRRSEDEILAIRRDLANKKAERDDMRRGLEQPKKSNPNREGLTYDRWYAAATYGVPKGRTPSKNDSTLLRAWRAGEDPTEWAASFGRGETPHLSRNPKLILSKGALKLGRMPIKTADLHDNLVAIGPLGVPAKFFGYDPSTEVLLFLSDDRFLDEIRENAATGNFPIFQRRRAMGSQGTIQAFWRHPGSKRVAAAAQYYMDGNKVVVTHLAVRPRFQRMGLGERMLKYLRWQYPEKTIVGTELTQAGRAFSEKHGVEELK